MIAIYVITPSSVMHMSVHCTYDEVMAAKNRNLQGTSNYALEKGIKIFPKEVCLHVPTSLPSFKKDVSLAAFQACKISYTNML